MAPADEGRAREARHHPRGRGRARIRDPSAPRARSSRPILEAEGRREAAFRDAEARERAGRSRSQGDAVVAEAIAGGDVKAINYFLGTEIRRGAGQDGPSTNSKVFFLPVEAAGIMASIAGIGELAKEAQARGLAGEAGRPRGSVPSSG